MKRLHTSLIFAFLIFIHLAISSCQFIPEYLSSTTKSTTINEAHELVDTKTSVPPNTIIVSSSTLESGDEGSPSMNSSISPIDNVDTQSLILYEDHMSGGFFNVDTGGIFTFTDGLMPIGWSPTGDKLLLINNMDGGLYIADKLGREMEMLFIPEIGVVGKDTRWLTDDMILAVVEIDMGDPLLSHPEISIINLQTGEVQQLEDSSGSLLLAVSPTGNYWLEHRGKTVVVYEDGSSNTFAGGIQLSSNGLHEWYKPMIAFLPDGTGLFFIYCESNLCSIYLSKVIEGEISSGIPVYQLGKTITADSIRVSPNGISLAWYDPWGSEFTIFDIENLIVKNTITWPMKKSEVKFIWSPDSTTLAISEDDLNSYQYEVTLININTGERNTYPDVPVGKLLDWREIE